MTARRTLTARCERFPIRGTFRISRGAKTEAAVVLAEVGEDGAIGRGECVPYARYGESVEGVLAQLAGVADAVAAGLTRDSLLERLPAGAARNALDCALWDLEAKLSGVPAWRRAGLATPPQPVVTAFTLSIDSPDAMAAAAAAAARLPVLKLKLAGDAADLARVEAVRRGAPAARLIVDANEAWTADDLLRLTPAFAALGVELIEQPLPASADGALAGLTSPVALAADESCHGEESLAQLVGRYRVANLKLDKTGGLTAALRFKAACEAAGLEIMVGCMVGTSLAMAPALLLAQGVRFVDLDGPLLLARDREPGLQYDGAVVSPPDPALWG
jgi:L-alanine-DL-glutamate epimerase-like enolase superfamily enzyme